MALFYGDEDRCTVHGRQVWGYWYLVYWLASSLGFLSLAAWSLRRLIRLDAGGSPRLQRALHSFCLVAAALRVEYLAACALPVYFEPAGSEIWQRLAGISYSSFFPLSVAAFICICQHWQRLIRVMDATPQRIWYRNPLYQGCCLFLTIEVARDVWYLSPFYKPSVDAIYFMWLALVDVQMAVVGVLFAWRLYERLREWLADYHSGLFRKTLVSAVAVSGIALCFLVLSIVQALWGRFYAWPSLACSMLGRCLEVTYLGLILSAIARVQQRPPTAAHGAGCSFESHGDESTLPSTLEPFWISGFPERQSQLPAGSLQPAGTGIAAVGITEVSSPKVEKPSAVDA